MVRLCGCTGWSICRFTSECYIKLVFITKTIIWALSREKTVLEGGVEGRGGGG